MGISGIASSTWDETEEMTGFTLVPPGHALDFEIEELREGTSVKGDEYVMVGCVHFGDSDQKYYHWEYFSFDQKRLGFFKAFLKGIGRADLMHAEADWEDLKETQFQSDIVHRRYQGEMKANLVYTSLVPVSHDCMEIPAAPVEEPEVEEEQQSTQEDEGEPEVAEKPTKQRKPAPRRAPRARTAR